MQKLFLDKTNRVFLDTAKVVDAVNISITGPSGSFLKDGVEADIEAKACTEDAGTGKFYYDVTLSSSTSIGDAFIYWEATLVGIPVGLESEFSPEDAAVLNSVSQQTFLVTPTYVINNFLRGIPESVIEATSPGLNYRDVIRAQILAATTAMEQETRVFFTPRTITDERHDYNQEPLLEKFWTQRMFEYPIRSVSKVTIKFNETETTELPIEWVLVGNNDEGMVKILPFVGSGSFPLVFAVGFALGLNYFGTYYIPDAFAYDYVAGLQFEDLSANEQLDIKNAIGRQVAITMLPNLDQNRGIASESTGIDGATTMKSYTSSAMYSENSAAIKDYKIENTKFINRMQRKYLKRLITDGYQ